MELEQQSPTTKEDESNASEYTQYDSPSGILLGNIAILEILLTASTWYNSQCDDRSYHCSKREEDRKSRKEIVVFIGYVLEEECAICRHASTHTQSETEEAEAQHREGVGETGCYTEEGRKEECAIEGFHSAEGIGV